MGGTCSTNGEKRNAYRLLVRKPEGKISLGRPRRRWVDGSFRGGMGVVWTGQWTMYSHLADFSLPTPWRKIAISPSLGRMNVLSRSPSEESICFFVGDSEEVELVIQRKRTRRRRRKRSYGNVLVEWTRRNIVDIRNDDCDNVYALFSLL
jgi:hypothetical protein